MTCCIATSTTLRRKSVGWRGGKYQEYQDLGTDDQPCQAVNSDCWLWGQTGVGSFYKHLQICDRKWTDCCDQQEVDGMYASFGTICSDKGLRWQNPMCYIEKSESLVTTHQLPVITSFILFSSLSGVWNHLSVSSSDLWGQRRFVHTDLRPRVKCSRTWVTRWVRNSMGLHPPR